MAPVAQDAGNESGVDGDDEGDGSGGAGSRKRKAKGPQVLPTERDMLAAV